MRIKIPLCFLPIEQVVRLLYIQKADELIGCIAVHIIQIVLNQPGGTPTKACTAIKAVLMGMEDDGRLKSFSMDQWYPEGSNEPDAVLITYWSNHGTRWTKAYPLW